MMHESPKVLSFIERLNTKVLRENEDLKNKMAELLDIAKNNQQLQDNLEILEQRLLKCRSVKDLVRTLERELKKRFRVEYVTFGLAADTSDAFFKERNRLSKGFQSTSPVFLETELLQNYFPGASAAPVLDSVGSVPVSPFFDAKASAEIRSVALVPLFIGGRIAGSLNMGSPDPRRYSPDKGTDFLVRLGNKISLAADNVLTHHRLLEAERTDPVTGLPNYSFFREVLRSEFGAFKEGGMPAACAIMGVDGLYALNDRFGPRAGNDALVHAAGVLKELTRKQDLSAHYGWDSIAAFFSEYFGSRGRSHRRKIRPQAIAKTASYPGADRRARAERRGVLYS